MHLSIYYTWKNKCIYAKQEIELLGLEIKVGQIVLQKHILEKIENFSKKIEDRKQLERFLGCLMLQISLKI